MKKNASSSSLRHATVGFAWLLTATTITLAVVAWLSTNHWLTRGITVYRLFPLFGLLALSTFWSQYVMVALSMYANTGSPGLTRYFTITNVAGLCFILLHPSLLIYQLWADGFGLPPDSITHHFLPPGYGWIVLLGVFGWLIFAFYLLSAKLHQQFEKQRWWQWFSYAGELAMLALLYHGFRLGDQLQAGWFRVVWLTYSVIFIIVLFYFHRSWFIKKLPSAH